VLWRRLIAALRERGRGHSRESGAFLLGRRRGARARIVDFILYDDLDPHALDTGIVRLEGRYFGALWDACRRRRLSVVADIHVHPGACEQSRSDREHPMISRAGHVALIVPDFARGDVRAGEIGIYRYLGAKRWRAVPPASRCRVLHIGP
jgi:proteasome lid subunit RPN8/RPN11